MFYLHYMNISADEILKYFPSFEKSLAEEISQRGEIRIFNEGEFLMRTGQYIRSTMLVLEGLVKIYREDDEGNEFFMYYIEGGKACALSMICALKQDTSEITAKAVMNTTVLSIPLSFMDQWMTQYKSWYQFVITSYRSRFDELLKTIDAIAFTNMDERLEFYLKKQVEKLGTNLKITHNEVAADLNSSREVISRLLKKMESKQWLVIHRNSIEWIKK